jgi:hypothetical protein
MPQASPIVTSSGAGEAAAAVSAVMRGFFHAGPCHTAAFADRGPHAGRLPPR